MWPLHILSLTSLSLLSPLFSLSQHTFFLASHNLFSSATPPSNLGYISPPSLPFLTSSHILSVSSHPPPIPSSSAVPHILLSSSHFLQGYSTPTHPTPLHSIFHSCITPSHHHYYPTHSAHHPSLPPSPSQTPHNLHLLLPCSTSFSGPRQPRSPPLTFTHPNTRTKTRAKITPA